VGDIAGMGADLFGSLAESTCAALVVSATSVELMIEPASAYFPLLITGAGIIVSFVTCFFATHVMKVEYDHVERPLKWQLFISTALMTAALFPLVEFGLPDAFNFGVIRTTPYKCLACVASGLWSGLIIGFITEFYTSNQYSPVKGLVHACERGAATNIIGGLALGYMSNIIPIGLLAVTIYVGFSLANMYGIALAALGMLSTLPVALAIDGYGPIADNAGGIAEMSGIPEDVRNRTDKLDAAGNTTAAIGKGFAIGSAALVGLALFGAFVTRTKLHNVNILQPLMFASLLLGAMMPYAFSALTMAAVGEAAQDMTDEIQKQFQDKAEQERIMGENGGNWDEAVHGKWQELPDYEKCIKISTDASIKKMFAPGLLVIGSPFAMGIFFGPEGVSGLLAGAIVSGVQIAISFSNTGGAWDNAKKAIEESKHTYSPENMGRFKEIKDAAVTGDTVGDPLKDTSGPSINILVKLSAITSLVFGDFFVETGFFRPGPGKA